jgi:transposase
MNQDDELQKKIIVLPQNRNTRRKHSKVDTNLNKTSIKRNEASALNNYKSLFKIDVQQTKQKTDIMTTRKYSKTGLEVAKAEIYAKIKEISHDYSESTNINSK